MPTITPAYVPGTAGAEGPVETGIGAAISPGAAVAGAIGGQTFVFFPADPDIAADVYTSWNLYIPGSIAPSFTDMGGRSRTWQDVLNDAGSWSATFELDEPGIDSFLGPFIDFDNIIAFRYKGQAAFPGLCEKRVVSKYAQDEDQKVVWSGRGALAILERAVVYPSRGVGVIPIEDNRSFAWFSPSYDDSLWGFAKELETIADAANNWAGLTQVPPAAAGFGDPTAFVLWADPYTYITAPPGQCFFRQSFTVPNDATYQICAVGDDWGHFYLDGQEVLTLTSDFQNATSTRVQLSAGGHTVAASVLNYFLADPAHNPGGFAWAVGDDLNGKMGTVHAHSDASAKIVPYSDNPPGILIGKVLIDVLTEATNRGVWGGVMDYDFAEATDSQGAPWPTVADISTQVGTDYLTFFKEIAATHMDFWMGPGNRTLHAVNIGTRGVNRPGVVLRGPSLRTDPTTGNVTHLTITDQG